MANNGRPPPDPSWVPPPPPVPLPAVHDPVLVEKAIKKARKALKVSAKNSDEIADLPFFLISEFGGAQAFAKEVHRQYKRRSNGTQFRRAILQDVMRACATQAERVKESSEAELSDQDLDMHLVLEADAIPDEALVEPPEVMDADSEADQAE